MSFLLLFFFFFFLFLLSVIHTSVHMLLAWPSLFHLPFFFIVMGSQFHHQDKATRLLRLTSCIPLSNLYSVLPQRTLTCFIVFQKRGCVFRLCSVRLTVVFTSQLWHGHIFLHVHHTVFMSLWKTIERVSVKSFDAYETYTRVAKTLPKFLEALWKQLAWRVGGGTDIWRSDHTHTHSNSNNSIIVVALLLQEHEKQYEI